MLVLERTASRRGDRIEVKAKPVGGGIQILDLTAMHARIGSFQFDSQRSRAEADFRIFIPPHQKESVIAFCLDQFRGTRSAVLDILPERELVEELHDSLGVQVSLSQFKMQWLKAVVETEAVPSSSPRARDVKTHHIYTIYQLEVLDSTLAQALLANSEYYTDADLVQRAQTDLSRGGWGRANAVLALPWQILQQSYLHIPSSERGSDQRLLEHTLTGSVRHLLDAPASFDDAYTA